MRCHENSTTWAQDLPTLRSAAKTHKQPNGDGSPKTRPIVGASSGMTTALGEILSHLVSPVSRSREDRTECQSTEELVGKIEETNTRLSQEGITKVMVGSMDVEALYPSVDQKLGAKLVAEEAIRVESNILM